LFDKLQNDGVTKKEWSECCYHNEQRGNKNANFKAWVNVRQRRRRGYSLDVGDRLVDLQRFGDCDATLGAEIGPLQAANEGVTKKE
jgi:hypothetical protein